MTETQKKDANPFTKKATEDSKRSILKTISWRALASIDTFLIAFIATGHAGTGAAIVSCEIFTKMLLYYLHERGWSHIKFGTEKPKTQQVKTPVAAEQDIVPRPVRMARRRIASV